MQGLRWTNRGVAPIVNAAVRGKQNADRAALAKALTGEPGDAFVQALAKRQAAQNVPPLVAEHTKTRRGSLRNSFEVTKQVAAAGLITPTIRTRSMRRGRALRGPARPHFSARRTRSSRPAKGDLAGAMAKQANFSVVPSETRVNRGQTDQARGFGRTLKRGID